MRTESPDFSREVSLSGVVPGAEAVKPISRRDAIKFLGFSGLLLASCTPGAGSVIEAVPTEVPVDPNSFSGTEIAPTPNPDHVVQIKSWRNLGEAETLAIPYARTTNGELLPLDIIFDQFKSNEDVKKLFTDQSSIEFSAMGIEVIPEGVVRPTVYPFFLASSEKESKGYIAMVTVEGPTVNYTVLNRVVENGFVGLGITRDALTGQEVNPPVMIFSSGLTEEQITQLPKDSLSQLDFAFLPRGLNDIEVPGETVPGASKVFAALSPEITPPVIEKDIEPVFTQEISTKYMGVDFSLELITDRSLLESNPPIEKVTIWDNVLAQYVARSLFEARWYNGNVKHTEPWREVDFSNFMVAWAKAQSGEGTWEDAQLAIYANDLATPGYNRDKVLIRPMFSGEVSGSVRPIEKISIVLVNGTDKTNFTHNSEDFPSKGFANNLEGKTLYIYIGLAYNVPRDSRDPLLVAAKMSELSNFMSKSTGQKIVSDNTTENKYLRTLLVNGGLNIYSEGRQYLP